MVYLFCPSEVEIPSFQENLMLKLNRVSRWVHMAAIWLNCEGFPLLLSR